MFLLHYLGKDGSRGEDGEVGLPGMAGNPGKLLFILFKING